MNFAASETIQLERKIKEKRRLMGVLTAVLGMVYAAAFTIYLSGTSSHAPAARRSVEASTPVVDSFQQNSTIRDLAWSAEYSPQTWIYEESSSEGHLRHRFRLRVENGGARVDVYIVKPSDWVSPLAMARKISPGARVWEDISVRRWGRDIKVVTIEETTLLGDAKSVLYIIEDESGLFGIHTRVSGFGRSRQYVEGLLDAMRFDRFEVRGESAVRPRSEEAYVAAVSKPSVGNILYLQCNTIKLLATGEAKPVYLRPSYEYCFGGKGTGFVISPDGHIATNGHVVKSYPEQSLTDNLLGLPELRSFLSDYLAELNYQKTGTPPSKNKIAQIIHLIEENPSALDSLYTSFYESIRGGAMRIEEGRPRYLVKLSERPYLFNGERYTSSNSAAFVIRSDDVYEADLVDIDYADYYSFSNVIEKRSVDGSDVAILRLRGVGKTRFPALPLSRDVGVEGQPLVVIGYPALIQGERVARSGFALLDYYTSSGSQTVTRGVISAIRRDASGRRLIQTDASIERGNSGGPALYLDGTVAGIATYAFLSQSGNYNFLRDVEDLRALMKKNNIDPGENAVYKAWKQGIQAFYSGKDSDAVREFSFVAEQYPNHPTVGGFVAQLDESVISDESATAEAGLSLADKNMLLERISTNQLLLFGIGGVTAFFLLLIALQAVQIQQLRSEIQRLAQGRQPF